jgi:hypothetical protein
VVEMLNRNNQPEMGGWKNGISWRRRKEQEGEKRVREREERKVEGRGPSFSLSLSVFPSRPRNSPSSPPPRSSHFVVSANDARFLFSTRDSAMFSLFLGFLFKLAFFCLFSKLFLSRFSQRALVFLVFERFAVYSLRV